MKSDTPGAFDGNPVIRGAFAILQRVSLFRHRARDFYYQVMLFQRTCPACSSARLHMTGDSSCVCRACGKQFDPTLAYGTCPDCDGLLAKRVFHYWCPTCRHTVRSSFCFDAKVFDKAYFREMMRESRQQKREKREAVRKMLRECRSPEYSPVTPMHLSSLPGLTEQLDVFVDAPLPRELMAKFIQRPEFDMPRYRQHILELVHGCTVHFEGVMPLISDHRLDRIFRFITLIFLQHEGLVVLTQTGGDIRIDENETHGERQSISGQVAASC